MVGLACTHVPATAGERVGVTVPRATGEENVICMSALDGAVSVPDAGEVETMESGVAGTTVVGGLSALLPPEEDLPSS